MSAARGGVAGVCVGDGVWLGVWLEGVCVCGMGCG